MKKLLIVAVVALGTAWMVTGCGTRAGTGAAVGAGTGAVVAGPPGAAVGAATGAVVGAATDVSVTEQRRRARRR